VTGVLLKFDPPPVRVPSLPFDNMVDVWRVELDVPAMVVTERKRLLSPDEMARAERFHFECHRRRFIVGRSALRLLIGSYLERPPEAIRFAYGKNGKPRLADPPVSRHGLEFNLSHSHELALVAVCVGYEVGVDLEGVRPVGDILALADRFFSATDQAALASCPEWDRELAFYRCWTRKEACMKAVGDGIDFRLDRFHVSVEPGDGAHLLAVADDPERAAEWSLIHIAPGPGYVGALALRTTGKRCAAGSGSHRVFS